MNFTRLSVTGGMTLLVALRLLSPEPVSATRKYSDPAFADQALLNLSVTRAGHSRSSSFSVFSTTPATA